MLLTQISLYSSIADELYDKIWHYHGKSCYYRECRKKATVNWAKAHKICESKQANLVILNRARGADFRLGGGQCERVSVSKLGGPGACSPGKI